MGWDGNRQGVDNWMDFEFVLSVDIIRCVGGLDLGFERRGCQDVFKVCCL